MSTEEHLIADRLRETAAMAMVGDGVLALIDRRRHLRLWYRGPDVWKRMAGPLLHSPTLTVLTAAAEVGVGVWLATRQRAV